MECAVGEVGALAKVERLEDSLGEELLRNFAARMLSLLRTHGESQVLAAPPTGAPKSLPKAVGGNQPVRERV